MSEYQAPPNPTHNARRERLARLALAVYWPLLATATHWPTLRLTSKPIPPPNSPLTLLQGDKIAHLFAFALLATLITLARPFRNSFRAPARYVFAAGIALAYAAIDEATQGLLPKRTMSLSDMLANALGIVGVLVLCLSAAHPDPAPKAAKHRGGALVTGLALLAVGGWLLAMTHTLGREAVAVHFVAGLGVTLTLLRRGPAFPLRPRLSNLVICGGVGLTLVLGEIAQGFTRLPFSLDEVFYGLLGLLVAMTLWSARLVILADTDTTKPRTAPSPTTPHTPAHMAAHPSTDTTGPTESSTRFVGHAVLVSVLTLLSRLTGLARDAVLAAAFGLSTVADAFFIGFLVPNLFRRLFGEGALTAAFIPHYTELRERDPQLARRFASLVLTLLTVLLLSITAAAELGLWWLASSLDTETQGKAALAVRYTRIMLPYMPLICLVALAGGVLQVHKKFGPPAAAPLVLNGVIIAATVFATAGFTRTDAANTEHVGVVVAVGVLLAGVLQLGWQLMVMQRTAGLTRCFEGVRPQVRAMLVMMGPMVLGLAVFQINALLDSLIAFFLSPPEGAGPGTEITLLGRTFAAPLLNGDVAALQWSQRLYQFPLGVFGIAIATAIFPALSAAAAKVAGADDDTGESRAKPQTAGAEFAAILRQGLRLTVFIGLPASVGLLLVRVPLARVVYERGAFETADALRVATILAGYATSVWAYSMMHTVTRAFYALKDATTPLKISVGMVSLNLALNLALIWPLGAAGLAWSTAISAMAQVALLLLSIRRRVGRPIDASVLRSWGRTALASAVMAAVLWPALLYFDPADLSRTGSALLLGGMTVGGGVVVLAIAKLAGAEELSWVMRRRKRSG